MAGRTSSRGEGGRGSEVFDDSTETVRSSYGGILGGRGDTAHTYVEEDEGADKKTLVKLNSLFDSRMYCSRKINYFQSNYRAKCG